MVSVFYICMIILFCFCLLMLEKYRTKLKYIHKVEDWANKKETYKGVNRYSDDHAKIFCDVHSKQLKEFFDLYEVNDKISFTEFAMLVEAETDKNIYKTLNKNTYKVKYHIYKNKFDAFECFTDPELFTKIYGNNAIGYSLYIKEDGTCYFVILCKRD